MHCPYCNTADTEVIDSRQSEGGESIRRRRMCGECGRRFTTYERPEDLSLKVIKKDGAREDFSRDKIKRGLVKATWKRPVSLEQIDELISEVERRLRAKEVKEVKSWEIGNLVINRLKKVDPVSYLLFACVYRDFDSLEDFEQELVRIRAI